MQTSAPKIPGPDPEVEKQNKLERTRAEQENVRAIQENVSNRTSRYLRRFQPRRSIISGATTKALA